MSLRLADHWIWDSWFAVDGDLAHVFFLHAPRALGNPDLRHHNATIGHAVSRDLVDWELRPRALGPGPAGAFDDLATWTGSVIRRDGRWLMFYTGVTRREAGLVQRIGLAVSDDLETWRRTPTVIAADPAWYEQGAPPLEEHWRDPWAFEQPDGSVHLLITARSRVGPSDERGVIGHAWSTDLDRWTVGPPLSEPGLYRQLEVPQLVETAGLSSVLFSAGPGDRSEALARREAGRPVEAGTHQLHGPGPLGPFTVAPGPYIVGDPIGSMYAGRLVRFRDAWHILAWVAWAGGAFVGELGDPLPARVDERTGIHLDRGATA